jgi:16S rRNA (uracil1498-N3)-methyltransferase
MLVGDGRGRVAAGVVAAVERDRMTVTVESVRVDEEPSPRLVLVQALAKGDRDELAVQAATELGVARVVPWAASRSVSRWEGAKIARGEDRWRAIVREASKQALRSRVPEVAPLASTDAVAALAGEGTALVVLDPGAERGLRSLDHASGFGRGLGGAGGGSTGSAGGASETRTVVLVVGPEGGIAPSELERFDAAGAVRVRLGPEVLRTSTAGPAALAALSMLLGRW